MAEPTKVEVRALLAVSRKSNGVALRAQSVPTLDQVVRFADSPGRDFVVVDRAVWIALLEAVIEHLPEPWGRSTVK